MMKKNKPMAIHVEAGKKYFWCSCGLSSKQPFCDGTHRSAETNLKSVSYVAEKSGTVYFCGCKKSSSQPICDGSHNSI